MRLNADPARRAAVHAATLPWVPSPAPGVHRRMLARIGEEQAQATSIVRYAAGSAFPRHEHPGGEEILVLEGIFEDEHGAYPPGAYLRNPPGSGHAPSSADGCVIFVKLRQFPAQDHASIRHAPSEAPDIALFESPHEQVRLQTWPPGPLHLANPAGLELLVLAGGFTEAGEAFAPHSWLRLPPGTDLHADIAASGCRAWIKTGHLR